MQRKFWNILNIDKCFSSLIQIEQGLERKWLFQKIRQQGMQGAQSHPWLKSLMKSFRIKFRIGKSWYSKLSSYKFHFSQVFQNAIIFNLLFIYETNCHMFSSYVKTESVKWKEVQGYMSMGWKSFLFLFIYITSQKPFKYNIYIRLLTPLCMPLMMRLPFVIYLGGCKSALSPS